MRNLVATDRLLARAANASFKRIRRDRQQAPKRISDMLAYIEGHLFDPGLSVNQLKERCGIRDNSEPIHFHIAVGDPPHAYIEDRRLETACQLLAETDLQVSAIANLLGYSSIQVFSRAFRRWLGEAPTQFRERSQRA